MNRPAQLWLKARHQRGPGQSRQVLRKGTRDTYLDQSALPALFAGRESFDATGQNRAVGIVHGWAMTVLITKSGKRAVQREDMSSIWKPD